MIGRGKGWEGKEGEEKRMGVGEEMERGMGEGRNEERGEGGRK